MNNYFKKIIRWLLVKYAKKSISQDSYSKYFSEKELINDNLSGSTIFDVGFYDGMDTEYYLRKGAKVIAFEANPTLVDAGKIRFPKEIEEGRLLINNVGIADKEGINDFFVNKINLEWSTFYHQAAINWGDDKYYIIRVPCITPKTLFDEYGIPEYLKVDIEGYDIFIGQHLKELKNKPRYVSFEASNRSLIRELLLAGYDSFKIVDQGKSALQTDIIDGKLYHFPAGSTGRLGDAAPGEWLCFENIMYLYFRFEGDMFSSSLPAGSWWDIHATIGKQADMDVQKSYMFHFIHNLYNYHCGFMGRNKPLCPCSICINLFRNPLLLL